MIRYLGVILVLLPCVTTVLAQSKDDDPAERAALRSEQEIQRQSAQLSKGAQQGPLSFRNFVRGGILAGNLIQVPYVTNVNVSAGYWGSTVSPSRITWPKGSGVEYGHTMSFIVSAEVVNDNGDTLRIASESYNRSGGDTHPTGSHKYFWTPTPGSYNMSGDPSTTNRLNNNADDREILARTGYYYVGGLNEDANGNGQLDDGEDLDGDDELDTELINFLEYPAQSNVRETWPEFWMPGSYVGDTRPECALEQGSTCDPDPGPRAGRWNGEFGSFVRGDQEGYYIADDRDNDEFSYFPFIDPATGEPDIRPWDEGGRRGLGVEVEVRHYQWASILAEDIFIGTFDVKNIGRKDIERSIIAMIVDYDIGDRTADNEALFDTIDDITYQWLKRDLTLNGFKVGYAGVGFLESPGISDDGIDNDADGMVDESREDGIDNDGDWRGADDVDGNGVIDNEDTNNNFTLDPGEDTNGDGALTIEPLNDDVGSDGLGPEDENYPGPDPDGTEGNGVPDPGEPNFEFTDNDEIDQIGLTGMVIRTPAEFDRDLDNDELFWDEYIQPGLFITPTETADIIYVYSSGLSQIQRDATQRFSIAFFCGNDFQDMLRNKRTMQNIYDADYNFAKPPREPFLTAVPGDGKVTLVWDQSSESSRDPIYGFDFEMYKVYRSTDPEFNLIKTITDAFGNPLLWEPLLTPTGGRVQYDIDNGLNGAHPVPIGDFGVSYDMGTDSGLEYGYVDSTVDNGRTYYYAVASVDAGYHDTFYDLGVSPFPGLADISPTESAKIIEVDAFERPTNVGRNAAVVVPQDQALGYIEASLVDGVQAVAGNSSAGLDVEFLIPDDNNSLGLTYEFTFEDDGQYAAIDSTFLSNGLTTAFTLRRRSSDGRIDTLARSNPRSDDIFNDPVLKANVYDGMRFRITNPAEPEPVSAEWLENREADREGSTPSSVMVVSAPGNNNAVPLDYEVRVQELGADTSNTLNPANRIPLNYQLWDATDLSESFAVPVQHTDGAAMIPGDTLAGVLSPGDVINGRVSGVAIGDYTFYSQSTWRFTLVLSASAESAMSFSDLTGNELYDSLAVYQIRGYQERLWGPDLEVTELDDFFESLVPWFEDTRDSILAIPGFVDIVSGMPAPEVFLDAFDQLYRAEVPQDGDIFYLVTSKPLDRDDVLRFTVEGNTMEDPIPASSLDEIYVVPDPYVGVNSLEPRNIQLSGRGERRIDFRNLPRECTIRIFTSAGRQVKLIEHSAPTDQSIATWNLKSDDGLDVSFGLYIYHVDAPGIGEVVKRFSIIK